MSLSVMPKLLGARQQLEAQFFVGGVLAVAHAGHVGELQQPRLQFFDGRFAGPPCSRPSAPCRWLATEPDSEKLISSASGTSPEQLFEPLGDLRASAVRRVSGGVRPT